MIDPSQVAPQEPASAGFFMGEERMQYAQAFAQNHDLGEFSLKECVEKLGAAFYYDLYVGKDGFMAAKELLVNLRAITTGNPFAPYFNIHVVSSFEWDEWCVSANGLCYGSKGA